MAIDGTKIIDSDLAHDIYREFMDLYDADIDIIEIQQKIEQFRDEGLDDEEFEIFITAYALALWETGNLTANTFEETEQSISKGAGIAMWLEQCGEFEAKERQKELEKFLKKISSPKNNPRKRKKYKKITNFIFQIDDIVAFQLPDESYRAAILANIFQYRGNCTYQFIATSYMDSDKPTESAVKSCSIFINKIGCGYDRETVKRMQPGIEKFWALDTKFSIPFTIGLSSKGIAHKDLLKFCEKFEVIGKAKIMDCFNELGSIGYDNTFEEFAKQFEDIVDEEVRIFKREMVEFRDLEN
ncbi:MAG: hypothetical protein M3Q99_03165 [Acidobacteriota bacterium]|nr:hypothetical protein [Acidobacteriota bacterium]